MVLAYFVPGLRIVMGLLFIFSASLKLPDLKQFAVLVRYYGMLPSFAVSPLAYTYAFLEFIVGWWILSGQFIYHAAIAGLLVMVIVDVFVFTAYLRGKKLKNCGCYGAIIESPLTWKKLVESGIWTLLFVFFLFATMELKKL